MPTTKPPAAKPEEYQSLTQAENKYPVYLVASLILNATSLVLLLLSTVAMIRLATRPLPTLVQTPSGETISARVGPHYHREPEVIKDFVRDVSQLLFTWSGVMKTPNQEGKLVQKLDPGVVVGNGKRITTPAYEGSFALASGFREAFQAEIAQLIPPDVWQTRSQVHIEFVRTGEPLPLAQGEWQVTQVANLIVRSPQRPSGEAVPFNKVFYLRAIDTPPLLLPEEATPLQRVANQVRSAQLEIYNIEER